jgi:hypothetical protein
MTTAQSQPGPKTLLAKLPEGIPENPRVMRLIDLDGVSHGLARGGRASNQDVQLLLDSVQATARMLDPQSLVRVAASTATAAYHLDVLMASGNNQWSIRRGLNGADRVLLEEMNDLINSRKIATRPGHKRPARHAELLILVGQDHIYAPPVRQLRLLGIPTVLVEAGSHAAKSLRSSACTVTFWPPSPPTYGQLAGPAC